MCNRMNKFCMMICVWLVLVIPVSVSALPITIVGDSANSTEKLGQFTAKLEYQVVRRCSLALDLLGKYKPGC